MRNVLLMCALLGALGCDQADIGSVVADATPQTPLLTERVQFNEIRPAFAGEDDSPETYMRVQVQRPILCDDLAPQQRKVERWVAGMLTGNKYADRPVRDALGQMCDDWFDRYAQAGLESKTNSASAIPGNWFVEMTGEVYFYNEDYLSYTVMAKEYVGGLHAFDVSHRYGIWGFREQRPLTVDDFFDKDKQNGVLGLVREAAAAAEGCTNYAHFAEENLADIKKLPDNIVIEDRGMEFIFNCYEIGCYSLGVVRANVVWDDLIPFMKEGRSLPWLPFFTKGGRIKPAELKNQRQIGNLVFGELE